MKKTLAIILALALVLAISSTALAESALKPDNYPKHNVGVVVQFSAGGPTDLSVRGVLDAVDEDITFAAENVTGGSGLIGLTKVATSATDGYTLGCINVDLAINYALGRTEMSPTDFIPLACSICDYYTLVVGADAPYDTLEEFVAYVHDHPGEVVIGDTGVGAAPYLAEVSIANFLDLDYKTVSYDGSADCITAVVGGHIDGTFTQLSPAKGQLEAGGLKAIACVANERMTSWPNIPTVKETYPEINFELASWVFISAYKGTDEAICAYLADVLGAASASDKFQETLAGLSMQNVPMTGDEALEFINAQVDLYKDLCKDIVVE